MEITDYQKLPKPSIKKVVDKIGLRLNQYQKNKPLQVLIFGFFGMRNIGDDVLLGEEIKLIKELKVPSIITVPSENPDLIKTQFQVDSFRIKSFISFSRNIFKADLIIFGGGGLICATGTDNKLSKKVVDILFDFYKVWFLFILPKILRKKVAAFGIGAYSNIGSVKKLIYLNALQMADFISVRDADSYNFLQNNLTNKIVNYEQDLAFLLKPSGRKNRPVQKKSQIGISLITAGNQKVDAANIQIFSNLINRFGQQAVFIFFPFLINSKTVDDLRIAQQIKANLKKRDLLQIVPAEIGAEGFFNQFGDLDYAICTRFHSQVFAYRQKIPFFGISYDNKCASFLLAIGAKWADINRIDQKILTEDLAKYAGKN